MSTLQAARSAFFASSFQARSMAYQIIQPNQTDNVSGIVVKNLAHFPIAAGLKLDDHGRQWIVLASAITVRPVICKGGDRFTVTFHPDSDDEEKDGICEKKFAEKYKLSADHAMVLSQEEINIKKDTDN